MNGSRIILGHRQLSLYSALVLLVCLGGPIALADPSPTGRSPRLLWSQDRQAVWNRMLADYNANQSNPGTLGGTWYKLIKSNADATGTSAERYNDQGFWAMMIYQITGDTTYVTKAYNAFVTHYFPLSGTALDGNFSREYFMEYVLAYEWLMPALTADQKTTMLNQLIAQAQISTSFNDPNWLGSFSATDYTIGIYFGLAWLHLVTGGANPAVEDLWNNERVGGFNATGMDRTTMRNAIKRYFGQMAVGGEYIQGSEYNYGTIRLAIMGAEGVRTFTGTDLFPEITQFAKDATLRPIYGMTSDLKQMIVWGDADNRRDIRLSWSQPLTLMLAGLEQSTTSAPYLQQFIKDLVAQYGATGYQSMEPGLPRSFYFFNPYAASSNWRTLPPTFWAPGYGALIYRNGWSATDSLFWAHMGTFPYSDTPPDHLMYYMGDLQLYRKGEWALTRPVSYSLLTDSALASNTMVVNGLSSMAEYKRSLSEESDNSTYAYVAATTGGNLYYNPSGLANPDGFGRPFLHEWTRSVVYLPSIDKKSETIVVYDRVNQEITTPNFPETFLQPEIDAINAAPHRKEWVLHTPVSPLLSSTAISWTTAGGQQVRVSTLLPASQGRTIYDEHSLPDFVAALVPEETKWHVRVWPSAAQKWDTFLNVIQAYDSGTVLTNTLVRSAEAGLAEGVLVQRGGHNDVLVMFNAAPGADLSTIPYDATNQTKLAQAHISTAGYTVNWSGTSPATDVYVPDLNPRATWSVTIDGRPSGTVAMSGQVVGRFSVSGTGGHSLSLRVTGGGPPAAPTGLRPSRGVS